MASGGWYNIPNKRKICEKMANAINMFFYKCYQNPLEKLLNQSSIFYQLWGPVTWPLLERWYTRNSWLEVFENISEFLIFLERIYFGSKILSSTCDKDQKFDYGCSSYTGNEAQSPDYGCFAIILGIFWTD